jgi:hypothetical protein
MSNTQQLLTDLTKVEYLSKEQAYNLARVALKEYSRRSKAAKEVDSARWNIALANGCPNAVYGAVTRLVAADSRAKLCLHTN